MTGDDMTVDDVTGDERLTGAAALRGLALFDGLDRRPARTTLVRRHGVVVRDRRRALPRGQARRLLVGAARRVAQPRAPGRAAGDRARGDEQPGPVGWWLPGVGCPRRLHGDCSGRGRRGGCCACRPRRSGRSPASGSPSASTSSPDWSTRCAASRPRPASASRWSPSAPSRPGSRTRSTTRPRRRPVPSMPWTGPPRRCSARCDGWGRAR